jgi:hypothetical protein
VEADEACHFSRCIKFFMFHMLDFFCIYKYGSPFLRVSWITKESCHLMHKRCLNVASSVSLTWVAIRRKKCGPRLSLCWGFRSCGDKKHESMMGIRYAYYNSLYVKISYTSYKHPRLEKINAKNSKTGHIIIT